MAGSFVNRCILWDMGNVDEVLAELWVERERLAAELARVDRVIEVLQEATGIAGERPERVVMPSVRTAPLPAGIGPYTLLDIYEATAEYLSTVAEPQNSTQIANALRAGGLKTRSRNLVNTVRVMLRRKDGRQTGISSTKDGKRWFIAKKKPPTATQV